ncbi:hypothetical protein GALMADRAFT_218541 [Galerina marginata CBS 339.88]|uniref:Beta-lactamase-related domain-containing protein n=1 Tax=Galerina marginata (strain CBS 339.88) TaxID=685588 RepID=A0A067U259_GALM3|nr:hypothetical protein GALMADRAFT_218541 [Galerina marginata CBS 339.88]
MGLFERTETPAEESQQQVPHRCNVHSKEKGSSISRVIRWIGCLAVLAVMVLSLDSIESPFFSLASASAAFGRKQHKSVSTKDTCQPPSVNLFASHPPQAKNDLIIKASKDLDDYLTDRVSKPDIDSISVGVVTSKGLIIESGYGVLRANESDEEQFPVDRKSIYRIASVTKMFTVLETLILRERGALNWDDSVEKYVPDFTPPSYGWAAYLDGLQSEEEKPLVTLRQLASHLAGIGCDYPPNDIGEWPISEVPHDFTPSGRVRTQERSYDDIMKALSKFPLVNGPYLYPIYSNIGIDLLGLANLAANRLASANASAEPQTHKELLQRDVLNPLRLESSFYRLPASGDLRAHIAVPKKGAEWADISLGDTDDPAGGQYSSLEDLATFMRTLLAPDAKGGVIPARVVREWLRPLHVWGGGGSTEQVGAPWEVLSLSGLTAFTKGGNLPGYRSEFVLVPEYSFGIIILMTGNASQGPVLQEVGKRVVPVFEKLHEIELRRHYAGTWTNGNDVAEIKLDDGALYVTKLVIRGIDVLKFAEVGRAALWSTGRVGEFRLAPVQPSVSCMPYWISGIDFGFISRGAPVNLLYWKNGVLAYPSAGVNFVRKH